MAPLDGVDLHFYGRGFVRASKELLRDDSQNECHNQHVCLEASHFFFLTLMRISLNVLSCYAGWRFDVISMRKVAKKMVFMFQKSW